MTPPDRLPTRCRSDLDRRRHAIRPLVESLEQRLQLSLVAVTGSTKLTNATYNQTTPAVAADAAGDYVVAWADDTDNTGYTNTIEAQVFNSNGTAKTTVITVNSSSTTTFDTRFEPSVAMDANGDFVVAWAFEPPNMPQTGYYYDILARRFTLAGTSVGNEFTVAGQTAYPNELINPTVAMNNTSFVIGWQLGGTLSTSPESIQAQRYSFSGTTNTAVGPNFTVASTNRPNDPIVAMDTAGDFVFSWDSFNSAITSHQEFYQVYNASGVAQGNNVSVGTVGDTINPTLAMNGAGRFVIAYQIAGGSGSGAFADIYAHQYALTGTESALSSISLSGTSDVEVYPQSTSFSQKTPSAAIDAQGFATIAWDEYTSANPGNDDTILARRLNPDGTGIETTPFVVAPENNTLTDNVPHLAVSPGGNAVFAAEVDLTGNPTPGSGNNIYDRLYKYVNDAPAINTPANQKIAENGSTTVPLTGITAGGNEEQTLTVTVSSSNTALIVPTVTYTSPNLNGTLNLNPFLGQFGTATITVTVTDSGGTANSGINTASVQLTLTVVGKPIANNQAVTTAFNTAKAITLTGSDPNTPPLTLTGYTVTSNPTHGTLSGTAPNLTYTPTAGYQGADSFTFTDSNGTSTSSPATVSITVSPPVLSVTSFTATSTGFTATFSEPFNPATLNLYTTGTNDLGPADVTLVGASTGPITGSLIFSPNNQTITFVRTAGVLPPDTYTVTLRSAANGFVDANGNLLSGAASPGTNYTTTFTATPTAARIIAIPNFARGPGQAVNVPATGTGLPLTISDGTGVTSIKLILTYNTALLTVTGGNLGSSAPAGASLTVNTSTPGSAIITFTSPTALPAGLASFASLIASVPKTAPYSQKEALVISGISINGGAITGTDDDAVHVVAYIGNATGSGVYSSADVTLIQRLLVGLDSGFNAYPLLDPTILADILGRGRLSSADASVLAQALNGVSEPVIPAVPHLTLTQGADPLVSIPQNLAGTAGSALTVPVLFEQTNRTAISLDSADVAVAFDPALFTVADVRLGDVPKGFILGDSIDQATGEILIWAHSAGGSITLRPGLAGTLFDIDLVVRPGAITGTSRINLLGGAKVGTQVFSTSLDGGSLTLVPAPTNSDRDPVDGVVTVTGTALSTTRSAALAPNALTIPAGQALPTGSPRPILGPVPTPSGPLAKANPRSESTRVVMALGVFDDLDFAATVGPSTATLIPWTTSEPAADSPASNDSPGNLIRKKPKLTS